MTWVTIFQLSIFILCSPIMVFLQPKIQAQDEHTLAPGAGNVNRTLTSSACPVDVLKSMADCSGRQLKDVPDDLPHNLLSFDLSSNLIRTLVNKSFLKYSLLENLDLSSNLIGFIDMATFYPLRQLISLSLDNNPIFSLPGSDIFEKLKMLSTLSLRNCNLAYFPNDTLGFLPQLQNIDLSSNELTFINISKCPKRSIKNLDLSFNKLQEISADVLRFPCGTNTADLSGNNFREIDPDVVAAFPFRSLVLGFFQNSGLPFQAWKNMFTGIAKSEIDELRLILAHISDIPVDFFDPLRNKKLLYILLQQSDFKCYPSIFTNLTSVYKMDLVTFQIGILEPDFFDGMTALRSLSASNTEMEDINPSGSSWKVDLRELDLSENNLRNLNQFTFKGLTNLTFLDLTSNFELMTFPITNRSGLDNLQTLNVSRNFVREMPLYAPLLKTFVYTRRPYDWWRSLSVFIPGRTFQYTPSLNHIDLYNSYVIMRELWDSSEKVSLFQGLYNLTYLRLKQNPLLNLPSGVFDDLSVLQVLDLSDCQISTIESGSFAALTSLTTLSLQSNKLLMLPLHIIDNLDHLSIFLIGDNALFYIDKALFAETQTITSIDLARNQLSEFNQTTFSPISTTLSSIDLSQNPIECSCKSQWLIKWLRGSIDVQNEKETTCSIFSLKPYKGEALVSIEPNGLCPAKSAKYASAFFGVLIVIIIIIIVYHYRRTIKYRLFLPRLAILGYGEVLDEGL